jgi:hypothetical protein
MSVLQNLSTTCNSLFSDGLIRVELTSLLYTYRKIIDFHSCAGGVKILGA